METKAFYLTFFSFQWTNKKARIKSYEHEEWIVFAAGQWNEWYVEQKFGWKKSTASEQNYGKEK